jgi:hypothetical protein
MSKTFQGFLLCSLLSLPILGSSNAHAAGAMFVSETGACLDVKGGNTADGTPVQASRCSANFAQQWNFGAADVGGLLTSDIRGIGTSNGFGKCVDVKGHQRADGTPVLMFHCTGSPEQGWGYINGHLINNASQKCLDIQALGTDGTLATIQPCNAFARGQIWRIQ